MLVRRTVWTDPTPSKQLTSTRRRIWAKLWAQSTRWGELRPRKVSVVLLWVQRKLPRTLGRLTSNKLVNQAKRSLVYRWGRTKARLRLVWRPTGSSVKYTTQSYPDGPGWPARPAHIVIFWYLFCLLLHLLFVLLPTPISTACSLVHWL